MLKSWGPYWGDFRIAAGENEAYIEEFVIAPILMSANEVPTGTDKPISSPVGGNGDAKTDNEDVMEVASTVCCQ